MKMKKAVALFMTASLAAGMLAGCGGSGDEGIVSIVFRKIRT